MNLLKNNDKITPGLTKYFSLKKALPFLLIVSAIIAVGVYEVNTSAQSNLLLQNSTELAYTEGNNIGMLVVTDLSIIPRYNHPEYEACIYTSEDEIPLITDIRAVESNSGSNTKTFNLLIDIPLEEIGGRNLNQNFTIRADDRCPINSELGIIVKEKESSQ